MKAIARLAKTLDVSIVQDEWRRYTVDEDVEQLHKEKHVDLFWQQVINLKSPNGTEPLYVALPKVVKSGLILAQTSAESE